ncbi:FAD-binding oxidoreductase [Herbiconiux solani]|uniref:FAD-binding oxidoreductase n=1 Tax=Herbiconiux solani TaxID=661329 RepID=UPI00082463B6|nr:FAD-linked oxidase C-terminal domain-containing protein [Herbiconiux solani]
MTSSEAVAELHAALGDRVSTDPAVLERLRTDKSGWWSEGGAIAFVDALTVDDVQTAVRIAARHGIPIVPRGAGTGLAGGSTSTPGSIVLGVASMNRILEISLEDELAVVEPGVINQHLSDALAPYGYVFSPDPASKAISSIGGNIATNAGGLLCAKYGVTREAVLGLSVVLADGSLIHTGRRTSKGVTGYDLTALLTGSEGTLGVIVAATVRIRPIPGGAVHTIGAFFADVTTAAAACTAVTAARIRPALMELMDPLSVEAVARLLGETPAAPGATYLLLQTDGPGAAAEAEAIGAVLTAAGALEVRSTEDPVEGERLLQFRRSMHPAFADRGEMLIEDICVPRSQLAAMFAEIERIGAEYDVLIPTIAHAGDGNLHPNFILPAGEGGVTGVGTTEADAVPDRVWAAADEVFRAGMRLGGTLTGEHGVGVLKRRWLGAELGDEQLRLQQGIKAVFDPRGLMNPGKVF